MTLELGPRSRRATRDWTILRLKPQYSGRLGWPSVVSGHPLHSMGACIYRLFASDYVVCLRKLIALRCNYASQNPAVRRTKTTLIRTHH